MRTAWLVAAALCVAATAQRERWLVTCVDDDGRPVEGAEVWVFQLQQMPDGSGNHLPAGPFTSAADGTTPTVVPVTYDGGKYSRWIYARVPGRLVGSQRCMSLNHAEPVVTLSPSRTIRGRVLVPEGFDPASVTVTVLSLAVVGDGPVPTGWFPRVQSSGSLANSLPDRFDRQADSSGDFAFEDFPARPFVVFATAGEGLAHSQWSTMAMPDREMPDLVQIPIDRESVLAGVLAGPDGRAAAGADVTLRFVDPRAHYRWQCSTRTDAAGRFRLDGLHAGEHSLTVESRAGVFRPQRLRLEQAASRGDLAIRLEAGVELRGVVADQAGEPIEGATVIAVTRQNAGDRLGSGRTDPQGRFALRIATGPAHVYLGYVPGGFHRDSSDAAFDLDVTAGDESLQALRFDVQR